MWPGRGWEGAGTGERRDGEDVIKRIGWSHLGRRTKQASFSARPAGSENPIY